MKKLSSLVQKKTKVVRVKDLLHKCLVEQNHHLLGVFIHASDLTREERKFCPRETVLMRKIGRKRKPSYLSPANIVTFDEGRAKQALLNNKWLRRYMIGSWRCMVHGSVKEWGRAPPGPCDKFQAGSIRCQWEYVEARFKTSIGISGGIDAIVDLGLPKFRVIEVKIIDKDWFKELKAPLAEHTIRTRLYLKLIAESSVPHKEEIDTTCAHVLYIMRGFGRKDENGVMSPFEEFIVERNDDEIANYIAPAHAVHLSREYHYEKFPCGVCSTILDPRAKHCPVAKECFSGNYGRDITWLEDGKPVHEGKTIIGTAHT